MKITLIILLLSAAISGSAQTASSPAASSTGLVDLLTNNNSISGCGFIVGGTADSLFVLTARHVVMSNGKLATDLKVSLSNNVLTDGKVLFVAKDTGNLYDIALVGISRKKELLPQYFTISNINLGTDVFFYRAKGATKHPQKDVGTIVNWEEEEHMMYSIYLAGILAGDSGSALFSSKGIVGMIVAQDGYYGKIININHIKKVINNWNNKYWQLFILD